VFAINSGGKAASNLFDENVAMDMRVIYPKIAAFINFDKAVVNNMNPAVPEAIREKISKITPEARLKSP
jgi:hypothetical protein